MYSYKAIGDVTLATCRIIELQVSYMLSCMIAMYVCSYYTWLAVEVSLVYNYVYRGVARNYKIT